MIIDERSIITQTIYSLTIMSTPNWGIINGVRYLVNEESHIQPRAQTPSPKKSKLKPLTLEEVRKWVNVPTYTPVVNSSGLITFIPK